MQVMPKTSTTRLALNASRREDPLPSPIGLGAGVFAPELPGQVDRARSRLQVTTVLSLHFDEMSSQRLFRPLRERDDSVTTALTLAHDQLAAIEVRILHPEPEAFEQAQSSAVEEGRQQALSARKRTE